MMKIGFDAKRAVQNMTGLGHYSRYVVEALQRRYPDVQYLLYAPRPRRNPRLQELLDRGGENTRLCLPKSGLWKQLSALWRIGGLRRQLEEDGIALFHGLSNELPLNICRTRTGVKSVVTIHDLIFLRLPGCYRVADRMIYNYKFRRACRHADHIIAVSECTKRDIVHFYGTPPEKISVIYQGCDPAFARPCSEACLAEVRARYGLPPQFLLSVGSIEERKNTLLAVRSLAALPEALHLVLVGKRTPYVDRLLACARSTGVAHRLHLLHDLPFADLPAVYRLAVTFVYPSRYEGFGIPILEALNAALPVVAATGSCLEEAGGPSSLYVAPDDAEALAAAVSRTLDPAVRQAMIRDGLSWAARFSMDGLAEQTMACYRRLLNRYE